MQVIPPICMLALAFHLFGRAVVYFWSTAFVQGDRFVTDD